MESGMRAWVLIVGLVVAGCGPSYEEQLAAMKARNDAAIASVLKPAGTPEQQMQHCLDIEIRAIVVRPIAADPPRAADVVMSDCSPHADTITRNMSLREAVQYNQKVRADVIAQIVEATSSLSDLTRLGGAV
jgi:hypothetical protein